MIGGGSRADTLSLVVLRPLAALFLAAGMLRSYPRWKDFWIPLGFALAATLLIALQLVPLPPAIWTDLPGRAPLIDVMRALDIPPVWRPLSMQAARTWNSLFAMMVPCATLLLCIAAGQRATQRLVPILIALGAVSALLGLLQIIGSDTSPLYLYRSTDEGFANGLFANRNHHAAVIACLLPLLAVAAHSRLADPRRRAAMRGVLGAFALFLIPLLLMTGSRAGLLLSGIGVTGAIWLYRLGARPRRMLHQTQGRYSRIRQHFPLILAVGGLLLLVAISVAAARAPSIDRLFGAGMEGGRRLAVYPTILRMVPIYLPFGTGFGTFAEVFQINEPDAILGPTYLNQAHNDWLQIIIEGGIPAALLALVALIAFARLARDVLAQPVTERIAPLLARAGLVILVILGLASLVDYPVRTPSIAALAIIAFVWMLDGRTTDRHKG
jgi:O-antigen ligase